MVAAKRAPTYVPERGDAVWLTFDSAGGHEQSGRRPAVIISPRLYNSRSGLVIAAAVTSQIKGYPFEVRLPVGLEVSGAILSDQVRTFDWRARKLSRICSLPSGVVTELLGKLRVLVSEE